MTDIELIRSSGRPTPAYYLAAENLADEVEKLRAENEELRAELVMLGAFIEEAFGPGETSTIVEENYPS